MEDNKDLLLNHLLRMYLDLSERYQYILNKCAIYEKINTQKRIMAEERKPGGIPQNSVEKPAEPAKKRGRPPKRPAAEQRVSFDASAKSDA